MKTTKILVITKMFPAKNFMQDCIFNKKLIDYMSNKYDDLQFNIIRPVIWIPKIPYIYDKLNSVKVIGHTSESVINSYRIDYIPILSYGSSFLSFQGESYYLSLIKKIEPIIKNYDIIHSHKIYPDGYASVKLGKKFNKPVLMHIHGSDVNIGLYDNKLKKHYKYVFDNCKALITVSNDLKKKIIDQYPQHSNKIHVAVNGVNLNEFIDNKKNINVSNQKQNSYKKIITFIGRVEDQKGINELLNACKDLKEKRNDFIIYLIGKYKDKDYKKYHEYVLKNNITDFVRFIGEVNHESVISWLKFSHFSVLPSYMEGTPMAVLESLASGTPVVATNIGGIPDLLNSYPDRGMLIDPNNIGQLTDAMDKMLDKNKDKESILKNVHDIDISRQSNIIYNLYKSISN